MTTQVIVKSPKPNHQDVQVDTVTQEEGEVLTSRRLTEGEEASFYVYQGQSLNISEIPKIDEAS
jgi:hypothetical protein